MSQHFKLPPLNVNQDYAIVNGFSSGGFLASQLIIAKPDVFKGAGILNGGLLGTGNKYNQYIQINQLPIDERE